MSGKKQKLPIGAIMAIGFFLTIFLGFLLLLLPCSQKEPVSAINCFFVSTSAVCVTGLSPIDIAVSLTTFGQNVVMGLIQIGGLGFAVVVVFFLQTMARSRFYSKSLVRESLGFGNEVHINRILKYTLVSTLVIEMLGAAISFTQFIKDFPFWEALHKAVFHSISAYNNAGFDLFHNSLVNYADNKVVMITTASLIIMGGLGYIVYFDLINYRRRHFLFIHTKIVLMMTAILLVGGTCLVYFSSDDTLLVSFFHATSARTAGFYASDITAWKSTTSFIIILLMFIGASPGSTGGGIKTTTFFTIIHTTCKIFNGKRPTIFGRKLSQDTIMRAFGLLGLALGVVIIATFLLTITEPAWSDDFMVLLFEVVSAFATVGLTLGITPDLSFAGKVIIILVMYIGRVGAITLVTAIRNRDTMLDYPEQSIAIG